MLSEDQRNALNALLFRTGEPSKKFMMVVATNRPGDLDAAVCTRMSCARLCSTSVRVVPQLTDRMDESMLFDLPDEDARRKLVSKLRHLR